ncbi:hypothetical protein BSKO_05063 [Bryopsis sp. KO-2023]|nr:hypothetical protein BSKO_05063 [Bryopsis sp. KO-2023]
MFKKHFSPSSGHKLSGADRKKLRRALEKESERLTTEDLDGILPAKTGDVELAKVSSPHRGAVYTFDGTPVVIDVSGKGDFVPTVFSLWRAPLWLPRIWLKHFAVSKFILGGADVMLPGVHVPSEGFQELFLRGALVSICVIGNPAPIAVGRTTMTSRDVKDSIRGKGKLVEIIHHFGDLLWQSHPDRPVPNPGFTEEMVLPIQEAAGVDENALETEIAELNLDEEGEQGSGGVGSATQPMGVDGSSEVQIDEAGEDREGEVGPSGADEGLGADMDGLLEIALLQAFHKSIKDDMLPLPAGILYQQHMVPNRFPGSTLDLKKSTFKKMSKFLQGYGPKGSKAENLLSLTEDKYSKETIVTRIDRKHIMYDGFRPYKLTLVSDQGATPSPQGGSCEKGFSIQELYRPGRELFPVFDAVGLARDGLYSSKDAGDIGFQYAAKADLDRGQPTRQHIVLDPTLCDALFKGLIKKTEIYPTHVKKSELRDFMLRRMSKQFKITRDGKELMKRGNLPAVQISEEKRMGNKKVTKVIGVEPFLLDVGELASACQKKFACSTTVSDLPGKTSKGQELVVQGQKAVEMASYFMEHYSIPKAYIGVKKAIKKKK